MHTNTCGHQMEGSITSQAFFINVTERDIVPCTTYDSFMSLNPSFSRIDPLHSDNLHVVDQEDQQPHQGEELPQAGRHVAQECHHQEEVGEQKSVLGGARHLGKLVGRLERQDSLTDASASRQDVAGVSHSFAGKTQDVLD